MLLRGDVKGPLTAASLLSSSGALLGQPPGTASVPGRFLGGRLGLLAWIRTRLGHYRLQ